ncbi:DUF5134 domain-containing protein [Saccharopolyspora rhizosphaerae]|uniref:DUF5134 domain-containing protein n=1 Tax=Saccharopolyspora rhizosphaerae TaxID=2492662 RepID=A0A3R8P4M0_9PSEU|nr:DUF5134 domain-containing protein [Saccharopolyspora rhizosphaerae]RRO19431.1 DUF5134 domain-containing protein [Saccharopolyspora rhizosphaerae]
MVEQVMTGAVVAAALASLLRLGVLLRNRTPLCHVDVAQLLMGAGMVAMHLTPSPALAAPFVAAGCWLAVQAARRRTRSHLHHAIGTLAMAYMFAAQQSGSAAGTLVAASHHHAPVAIAAEAPGFAVPLIAWALMAYCALSAGFAGTDLLRTPAPKLRSLVELALSAAMAHMFLAML